MNPRVLSSVFLATLLGCATSTDSERPLLKVRNGKCFTAKGTRLSLRPLSHASCALAIEGWEAARVREEFGGKPEVFKPPSAELMYGRPHEIPPADEQWVFSEPLQHVVVYLKGGKVVLAVAEWSDF